MKPLLLPLMGFLSLTLAAPSFPLSSRQETPEQATDRLLFSTTIDAFEAARNALNPPTLDWSSDGCSDSPDNPFGFDFLHSCHRHVSHHCPFNALSTLIVIQKDFGYRNYKAQSRFTDANKAKIDSNFKNDMYNQCSTEGGVFEVAACKGVADVYYEAVKEFGSKRAIEFGEKVKLKRSVEA